jgi:hypothetical protein
MLLILMRLTRQLLRNNTIITIARQLAPKSLSTSITLGLLKSSLSRIILIPIKILLRAQLPKQPAV